MALNIETEIDIDAPPEAVWEILADFKTWKDWNPFITGDGEAKVGASLLLEIAPPGKKPMKFSPKVQIADAPKRLEWLGRVLMPGIFDGHHCFHLEVQDGGTRLRQFENFTGILVGPVIGKQKAATELGFMAMNRALKKRAEKKD